MTAIAWKNGVLATDSRETSDYNITDDGNKKIHKHKHFVLAACGNSSSCAWFYNWMYSNFMLSSPQHADEDGCAYLVDKKEKKLYRVYCNGQKEEINSKIPHSDGNCYKALKILLCEFDLTPAQAIKKCAKHDVSINSVIQQVKCW